MKAVKDEQEERERIERELRKQLEEQEQERRDDSWDRRQMALPPIDIGTKEEHPEPQPPDDDGVDR